MLVKILNINQNSVDNNNVVLNNFNINEILENPYITNIIWIKYNNYSCRYD